MIIKETYINGLYVITPQVYMDDRGHFFESYKQTIFSDHRIDFSPIQDNESFNKQKGTLRGFHLQIKEFAQAKLVRCITGSILDIAIDLRPNSPTFGQHYSIILNTIEKSQLFIPKGFAHAFLTLEDNTIVQYKVDNYYSKDHDISIAWNDKDIAFPWDTTSPILSHKDQNAISLKEFLMMN